MGYWLEEHLENGQSTKLGDPFFDLQVAKVIASQRAVRVGRVIVVADELTNEEIARYEPNNVPTSVKRMRAAVDRLGPAFRVVEKTSA